MVKKKGTAEECVLDEQFCYTLEEYGSEGYCCINMNLHIHEKEKIIEYNSLTQEYAIKACGYMIQSLTFCPWCGAKLPQSQFREP